MQVLGREIDAEGGYKGDRQCGEEVFLESNGPEEMDRIGNWHITLYVYAMACNIHTDSISYYCYPHDISHDMDHIVKFHWPSPSVFAYCKQSNLGGVEDLRMRLETSL